MQGDVLGSALRNFLPNERHEAIFHLRLIVRVTGKRLAATPNSDPRKIGILRVHMMGGVLILALMVFRFIVRMRTSRPADATTGYPLLDRIAPISHYGFYVLVPMMVGTGFATAIIAGLGEIVFWFFRRPVTRPP